MSKSIILNSRPSGKPQIDNFKFVESSKPSPGAGELLLKTKFVSVDPYIRGRMNEGKSYVPPFNVGEPINSGIVAEVVESQLPGFNVGDFVAGSLNWSEFQLSNGEGLRKVDPKGAPLSAYQAVLGMPGLTAYHGLLEIGTPKPGETIVVSGAAGAVGSIVGQIGKILGCHVVGIAGSDEKVDLLKNEFGFDAAINYKTTKRMHKAIAEVCPNGVDIYFDNVGGEISDGVLLNINKFARIIICGAISLYNETRIPMGPRMGRVLLVNSALMKGFIVNDYAEKFPEGIQQLAKWLQAGELVYKETIIEGFDNIPKAFIGLFEGANVGKMMVKVY